MLVCLSDRREAGTRQRIRDIDQAPLLLGAAYAGGGCAADQTMEGYPAAHRTGQAALRARRPDMQAAAAPSPAALGLRQPQNLK
jgi:hypothetical protein